MADRTFFKWLKQHLNVKKFLGDYRECSENPNFIGNHSYCLVVIVQHDVQLKRSTYEVLQILCISLMDKTPLVDIFERTDFNNVKELDCPPLSGVI